VAEPAYAVVDILCDPAQLEAIEAVPNLLVPLRPEYTDDPGLILVHALADEDAQAAVAALGCTVTVLKSAEEYQQQLDAAYAVGQEDGGDGSGPIA
jgi:hypothetical protein